jgi:TPR repeat protein
MKRVNGGSAVIDTEAPWKLKRRNLKKPPYAYTMSPMEWQALLARAKQGDAEAEWEVAGRYEDGCSNGSGEALVRRSSQKTIEWTRRAAEHGLIPAQIALGVLLGKGAEALAWTKKAYRAGKDSCAANNIAVTYRENGNLRMAVQWFRRCVALGDDDAQVQLGLHYYWGKGVRKNPEAAVRCFRKATKGKNICEAGRNDAYFYLGFAYFEGNGVKQSFATARRLFQRANVDGDHQAASEMLRLLPQRRDESAKHNRLAL